LTLNKRTDGPISFDISVTIQQFTKKYNGQVPAGINQPAVVETKFDFCALVKKFVFIVAVALALGIGVIFSKRGHAPTSAHVSVVFHGMSNSAAFGWVGIFSITNTARSQGFSYDYTANAEVLQTNGWRQLTHSKNGAAVFAMNAGTLKPSEADTYIVPEPATNQLWRFRASIRTQNKIEDFLDKFPFLQGSSRVYDQHREVEIENRKSKSNKKGM
jgi:hypothetical protein